MKYSEVVQSIQWSNFAFLVFQSAQGGEFCCFPSVRWGNHEASLESTVTNSDDSEVRKTGNSDTSQRRTGGNYDASEVRNVRAVVMLPNFLGILILRPGLKRGMLPVGMVGSINSFLAHGGES
jgi:hypothetical protein